MTILLWIIAIIAYLTMAWFAVLIYNLGQVKEYGHILDDEDEIFARIFVFLLWPLSLLIMILLKLNNVGRKIAEEAGKDARAKAAQKVADEEKRAKFKKLLEKAKADAEKAAIIKAATQKLLDETKFERSEETNWKAAK